MTNIYLKQSIVSNRQPSEKKRVEKILREEVAREGRGDTDGDTAG